MIFNFIYPTINADINTYNLTTKMLKLTNYQTKLQPFPVIVGISPFDFTKESCLSVPILHNMWYESWCLSHVAFSKIWSQLRVYRLLPSSLTVPTHHTTHHSLVCCHLYIKFIFHLYSARIMWEKVSLLKLIIFFIAIKSKIGPRCDKRKNMKY